MFDKLLYNKQDEFCFLTDGQVILKKTEKKKLKNFPASYLVKFYRNLADSVEIFLRSDFYGRIANDADRPSQDVKKCLFATSDFSKGMQDNSNHCVTRDRIKAKIREKLDKNFRQKLDPIAKNILRSQNPL